jgi:hypothetical protein
MVWTTKPSKVKLLARAHDPAGAEEAKPAEIVSLLSKVERFLQEGHPENALEVISRSRLKSSWVTNANGVCLLRLDRAKQAVDLFRGLVLPPGTVTLRADAPAVFKTNFATALLADDNLGGCLGVLHEIDDEENPAVQQLRVAIQRFRESLSLWTRLQWRMGMPPSGPVPLGFPPGNLE